MGTCENARKHYTICTGFSGEDACLRRKGAPEVHTPAPSRPPAWQQRCLKTTDVCFQLSAPQNWPLRISSTHGFLCLCIREITGDSPNLKPGKRDHARVRGLDSRTINAVTDYKGIVA